MKKSIWSLSIYNNQIPLPWILILIHICEDNDVIFHLNNDMIYLSTLNLSFHILLYLKDDAFFLTFDWCGTLIIALLTQIHFTFHSKYFLFIIHEHYSKKWKLTPLRINGRIIIQYTPHFLKYIFFFKKIWFF